MKIGHFIPSYTPICAGLLAQTHREAATLCDRLGYTYKCWDWCSSDISRVRNRALHDAIEWGMDYLCMQDSDIWSKSSIGAIAPLLSTAMERRAAMVAAICGLRRKPHTANVQPCKPGEIYEAEKVGTGLVLIDVAMVKQMLEDEGGIAFDRVLTDDGCDVEIGEDIWFSRRLREAGLKIYVDGRVPTTHVRRDVETLDYPGTANAGSQPRTETQAAIGNA